MQTDVCRAGEVNVSQPRKSCSTLHISTMYSAHAFVHTIQKLHLSNSFSQLLTNS